jgi:hypothetical protein
LFKVFKTDDLGLDFRVQSACQSPKPKEIRHGGLQSIHPEIDKAELCGSALSLILILIVADSLKLLCHFGEIYFVDVRGCFSSS